jgi:4-alpha-glucanotransferase
LDEYKNADQSIKKLVAEAKQNFNDDIRFSHYNILKAKLEILRALYSANKAGIEKSAGSGSLAAWIKKNPWAKEYAVYRRLKEKYDLKSWKEWPDNQIVSAADIEKMWKDKELREEHLFCVWLQAALDAQLSKAAKVVTDAGIILKGDLPILINEDSCDVWAHPEYFIQELSAGAPPDMYCPEGQNWGFPIFNWETQEKDNYAWWRGRIAVASKYYQAYRIDHVLGFFRIWVSTRDDYSAVLGRYEPYIDVTTADLKNLDFDKSRIRWISQPHITTEEVFYALRDNWEGDFDESEINAAAEKIFSQMLERINDEELWLFNSKIKGEKDIDKLDLNPAIIKYLIRKWQDRIFIEYEKGKFFPVIYYKKSTAYKSLSEDEKINLEALLEKRHKKSEKIWEAQGMKLLSILAESSEMLPCAEDLGTVPPCVPKVLAKLKILGLRVVRWLCEWEKENQLYIPLYEYPELSVCTASVHDSTTVREWWEGEADQEKFSGFVGVPALPKIYNPGAAKLTLSKIASARSRFRIFLIQDLLHLSNKWYADDPAQERINVPGTNNDFNWTYRLPATIEEISKDEDLIRTIAEISGIKAAQKKEPIQ